MLKAVKGLLRAAGTPRLVGTSDGPVSSMSPSTVTQEEASEEAVTVKRATEMPPMQMPQVLDGSVDPLKTVDPSSVSSAAPKKSLLDAKNVDEQMSHGVEAKDPGDTVLMAEPICSDPLPARRKRKATNPGEFVVGNDLKRKKPSAKKDDPEVEFEQCWICCECKEAECMLKPEADQLLICEGACRRLFHYPCAGLSTLPAEDEEYICPDCTNRKHCCAICQQYGEDDQDVFLCSKDGCGFFYHESCLSMQNIEVRIVPREGENKDSESTVTEEEEESPDDKGNANQFNGRRVFVCPAHWCWTCTQTDEQEKDAEASSSKKQKKKKGFRKKKGSGGNGNFDKKSETRLIRCLECPISYHMSCIPPPARFHELALLCHEHASTCKLPDLDAESSFQAKVEKSIDDKFNQAEIRMERARKSSGKNLFFPGMTGDKITVREAQLLERDDGPDDLMFCLPCDIRDEVHSKPPSYHHINSLRYDPMNRPPRIASSGEVCQCVNFCGDDCLNRMLYVECSGDANQNGGRNRHSNCRVGGKCGNRQLGQRKFKKCRPMREKGKGWGLTLAEKVMKGDLVQEYVGEVVDEATKEKRLIEWAKDHPNDPNFYLMALKPGWFIDARLEANLSRFINHSCEPNCILLPINVGGYIHNGIFALRDIAEGEFLSYDYHFDTRHGDRFVCRCGSDKCRGTMKGGKAMGSAVQKTKTELWEEAKARFERDKKFVDEYLLDEEMRSSQVGAAIPGAENKDETVANGVQERHKETVIGNRIFLWRNAVRGSDFADRVARLEKRG